MDNIQKRLFAMADDAYKSFQSRLLPTIPSEKMIGVRLPELRKLARQLRSEGNDVEFMDALPHGFYDEDNLHIFLISEIKSYSECLDRVERFLPYIDNWATCDSLRPRCFAKHKAELLESIPGWISSGHEYTVRFGMEMLLVHFLDEYFDASHPELVASGKGDYYVDMMKAWYFATALAKQWDTVLPWLSESRLSPWVHNKTIQKALESSRITKEQKELLRMLKMR